MSTNLWSLFLEDYVFAKPRHESVEGKLILFVECEEKMLRRAGARGELRAVDGKKRVGNGKGGALVAVEERVVL